MTTLNIGSSILPMFEELVNSVESNPGSEGETKQHNHNGAANCYKGNKFGSVIRLIIISVESSVVVVVVVVVVASFASSIFCHLPSSVGKPRNKPQDRNLKHDGGGVDGDVDEGGEDQLVVAGLEAVHHEGAEHDREDGLNNGVGNSEAVQVPSYEWGY